MRIVAQVPDNTAVSTAQARVDAISASAAPIFRLRDRTMTAMRRTSAVLRVAVRLCALALAWGLTGASAGGGCPVPEVDHLLIGRTCPKVGHIGNVQIAVPQHYLLGPFTYEGVDIWNPKSFAQRPRNPTLATPIDNFAIRIQFPEFRPIETRSDRQDYAASAESPKGSPMRWIHVSFETYDADARGTKKQQLKNWLRDDEKNWGPFKLDPTPMWGLQHYVSQRPPTTDSPQREIFYDPATEGTFISCRTRLKATPSREPFTVCEHSFYLRDHKVDVDVSNMWSKEDVKNWREVERGIRTVFESFIVR